MPGRPAIPQTRRSTYRPLNQMNGDFLFQLKRPLCSELSPEIRGTNKGKAANCRHKVKQWYKDQEFNIRKMSRAEDGVYDTFLRVHKEKKRLLRESYKHQQEEARFEAEMARERAMAQVEKMVTAVSDLNMQKLDRNVITDNVRDGNVHSLKAIDNMTPVGTLLTTTGTPPLHHQEQASHDSIINKSKVITVSKDTPKTPKEAQRNKLNTDCKGSSNVNINDINNNNKEDILCEHNEASTEESHPQSMKVCRNSGTYESTMPVISESDPLEIQTYPDDNLLSSKSMGPLTYNVSDTKHPKSSPLQNFHSLEHHSKLISRSLDQLSRNNMSSSQGTSYDSARSPISMVLLNKKQARERDLRRKMILDSEPLAVYMKDNNGEIIPDITGFNRKSFDPPSNREKYFQKKMLRAQEDARDVQNDRIIQFFEKLDIDKDAENEYRRFRAHRAPTPEKVPKDMGSLGASLEQIAHVFNKRHQSLPDNVDPYSIEAMQFCGYLRSHDFDQPKNGQNRETLKSPRVF